MDVEVLNSGTEVVVEYPDYQPWRQVLNAEPGSKSTHPLVELEKVYAKFMIRSKPSGANITFNGSFKGKTPLEVSAPADKNHKVQIFHQGFQAHTSTVKGSSGDALEQTYTLKPIYGTVSLNLRPKDAEVWIDGKMYSGDVSNIRLQAKPYTLVVKREGYISQEKQFTPTQNTTQIFDIELYTPENQRFATLPKAYKATANIDMRLMRPNSIFYLGAPRREPGRRANETQRKVKLDQAFYAGVYEVTNSQYRQYDPKHNSKQIAGQSLDLPTYPVVNVSWEDAARFCNWLSQQENFSPYYIDDGNSITGFDVESEGYRLPTEAEWAWLARIHDEGNLRYAWGNTFPPDKVVANFNDLSASHLLGSPISNYQDNFSVTAPVGSFPKNAKGLFDMAGNVSEWVNDYYEVGKTHLGEPLLNPRGPEAGSQHVIRGASWKLSGRSQLRLSYRNFGQSARDDLGFRIVRTVK
jgi:formylglycine-generating enzyme required for sulfatase activity